MTLPAPAEYSALYNGMAILAEYPGGDPAAEEVEANATRILRFRSTYAAASKASGVPWWWIGCIHEREASGDFSRHLHNGDPLTARTVDVPAGRPVAGKPPFAWAESAADALAMKGLGVGDWSIGAALRKAEAYNGPGYAARGLPSPYVWGATTVQRPGTYISDHNFSGTAWNKEPGVAALMLFLSGLGVKLT